MSATAAAHNSRQRGYFERSPKPAMAPRRSPYLERHVDVLLELTGIRAGDRVLEVGCGMGRYTLPLADRGVRVEGIDLSAVLLERLRGFAGARDIPLHPGDVAAPPATVEGPFDAVVGLFALHHVHELGTAIAGAARLVRPGGHVAFLEPNPYNPLYYLQMLIRPGMGWAGDGGLVRMRRGPVLGAMRSAGLVDARLHRFGFFPPDVANRPRGRRLERGLERLRPLGPVLPFQVLDARRP